MSLKFRRDGAVFPTEVRSGELIIHMGTLKVNIPFKFLKEDFGYDNTEFSLSNIMCYLRNDKHTIIMRFDGTVTLFNEDNVVVGFTKFDLNDIYSRTEYIPIGIVIHGDVDRVDSNTPCSIYSVKDSNVYFLECIGDPEPIMFLPSDNPLFIDDILKGNRCYPRLIRASENNYRSVDRGYLVNGVALKTTGYIEV